ncbi:MAG: type II toxin-antitoxin system VapC family toxin [Isosphaeraceae bacterium]
MKYVLDVNVALKWVLNEVDSTSARRLRDNWRAHIHELLVPDVLPFEAAHALTRAERRRLIADAAQFWGEIMADCPRLFPSLPLAHRALAISRQARIGFYDCLYVALAAREACELVTL